MDVPLSLRILFGGSQRRGYSFLAFIFLSDVVLYSPLSVNIWIPVGIFIIRCFDSQEREHPTLSENLILKSPEASTDVSCVFLCGGAIDLGLAIPLLLFRPLGRLRFWRMLSSLERVLLSLLFRLLGICLQKFLLRGVLSMIGLAFRSLKSLLGRGV